MKLDYKKLSKDYPKATSLLGYKSNYSNKLIKFFDSNGVRVYLGYGASGGNRVEVYRKRTSKEFKKLNPNSNLDLNWQMTRIGIISSFNTRDEALKVGFEEAFKQLEYLINNKDENTN